MGLKRFLGALEGVQGTYTALMGLIRPYAAAKRLPLHELIDETFTKWYGKPPSRPKEDQILGPVVLPPDLQDEVSDHIDVNKPNKYVKDIAGDSFRWAKRAYDAKREAFDMQLNKVMDATFDGRLMLLNPSCKQQSTIET